MVEAPSHRRSDLLTLRNRIVTMDRVASSDVDTDVVVVGASVQTRDQIGLAALQLSAQQLPEQMVIPIPATRHVQWHHEYVVALDLLKTDAEPEVCSTASHSAPLRRPNTERSTNSGRKNRTCIQTSRRDASHESPGHSSRRDGSRRGVVPGRGPHR